MNIKKALVAGSLSFNEAVSKFSDDENSKFSAGSVAGPNGSVFLTIDMLDKDMVVALKNLKPGQYSAPQVYTDERSRKAVRLIYLKRRTEPHRENLLDDYNRISQRAIEEKKSAALEKWFKDHIPTYYVSIDKDYAGCDGLNDWKAAAAKAFFIIGHYKALGFSPFSIESPNEASSHLQKSYNVLEQLAPTILKKQWINMDGFLLDKKNKTQMIKMGKYNLYVSHQATLSWSPESKDSVWSTTGGMIIQTSSDEFLIAGSGLVVTFQNTDSSFVSNIATADEVSFINGLEVKGRRMNGDQDHQGRHIEFAIGNWGIQKVKIYNSQAKID